MTQGPGATERSTVTTQTAKQKKKTADGWSVRLALRIPGVRAGPSSGEDPHAEGLQANTAYERALQQGLYSATGFGQQA